MIVLGVTLLATLDLAFRIKDRMLDDPTALVKPTLSVAELPAEGVKKCIAAIYRGAKPRPRPRPQQPRCPGHEHPGCQ
jgi:hypothetical protein